MFLCIIFYGLEISGMFYNRIWDMIKFINVCYFLIIYFLKYYICFSNVMVNENF